MVNKQTLYHQNIQYLQLANNVNTEDSTPGYNVKVFKSTSLNSGSLGGSDVVSSNDYQFDYKTGVLQFETK